MNEERKKGGFGGCSENWKKGFRAYRWTREKFEERELKLRPPVICMRLFFISREEINFFFFCSFMYHSYMLIDTTILTDGPWSETDVGNIHFSIFFFTFFVFFFFIKQRVTSFSFANILWQTKPYFVWIFTVAGGKNFVF